MYLVHLMPINILRGVLLLYFWLQSTPGRQVYAVWANVRNSAVLINFFKLAWYFYPYFWTIFFIPVFVGFRFWPIFLGRIWVYLTRYFRRILIFVTPLFTTCILKILFALAPSTPLTKFWLVPPPPPLLWEYDNIDFHLELCWTTGVMHKKILYHWI